MAVVETLRSLASSSLRGKNLGRFKGEREQLRVVSRRFMQAFPIRLLP